MSISNNSKPCICRYFRQKSANRAMSSMLACFRKWKEHLPHISKFEMSHLHVTICLYLLQMMPPHSTIYALSRFSLTNFPIHVTFFICVLLTKVNRRQNMRKVQPRVSSPFQISQILNRNKNVDNALERNLKLSEHYLVKDDCVRPIYFSRNL